MDKKKRPLGLKRVDFGFTPNSQKRFSKSYSNKSHGAFDFLELIKAWEEIIGKNFAKKTIPLKHKGDTLTILTEHSSYSAQLKFLEKPLIEKIGRKFEGFQGKIKRINFQSNTTIFKEKMQVLNRQIQKENAPEAAPPLHPQSPEYHRLKQQADQTLGELEDEELKKSLESIFIQMKTGKKE